MILKKEIWIPADDWPAFLFDLKIYNQPDEDSDLAALLRSELFKMVSTRSYPTSIANLLCSSYSSRSGLARSLWACLADVQTRSRGSLRLACTTRSKPSRLAPWHTPPCSYVTPHGISSDPDWYALGA